MTKPKTKRAPRSKTSKAPVFDGLTPAQAKAQIKKSIEEFRAANSQGHKMPPATPTAAEDRVLSKVEAIDDQAHDFLMEFGRCMIEELINIDVSPEDHAKVAAQAVACYVVDRNYQLNPYQPKKKGRRNA